MKRGRESGRHYAMRVSGRVGTRRIASKRINSGVSAERKHFNIWCLPRSKGRETSTHREVSIFKTNKCIMKGRLSRKPGRIRGSEWLPTAI